MRQRLHLDALPAADATWTAPRQPLPIPPGS
jgi:hypothetical protein